MAEHVSVCEVGPRDGLQMAHGRMPTAPKSRWIAALAAAGVAEIEVGSFVPASVVPAMADTGEIVRRAARLPRLTVVALAPNLRGAKDAVAAGAHKIVIPVSVSEGHSRANLRRAPAEQVPDFPELSTGCGSSRARSKWRRRCRPRSAVRSTARCRKPPWWRWPRRWRPRGPTRGACRHRRLRQPGAGAQPRARGARRRRRALGRLHLHDTMGLGLANALAGLEEGVRTFDAALAGLGGCPFAPGASGNIVTEDLVFMLESMGFATGIDLAWLLAARRFLAEALPEDELHGGLGRAGIPRTFRAAA